MSRGVAESRRGVVSGSLTGMAKRFRATRPEVDDRPDVKFSVDFLVDDQEVEYHFTAKPDITYGDIVGLKRHEKDPSGAAITYLDRIIRRALRDDDGVPAKWEPQIKGGKFTAPDGTEHPVSDLEKFTSLEAASSRRRWVKLIDSDDAVIHYEQVIDIFQFLAEQVAERPTLRSPRS